MLRRRYLNKPLFLIGLFAALVFTVVLVLGERVIGKVITGRPALSPGNVQITMTLAPPSEENTRSWMKEYWKINVTVRLSHMPSNRRHYHASGTFNAVYPYVKGATFRYAPGTQFFRGSPDISLYATALKRSGLITSRQSAWELMKAQNIWGVSPDGVYPFRYRLLIKTSTAPQHLAIVYIHEEKVLWRNLSWSKIFHVKER